MPANSSDHTSSFGRGVRKFLLSAFVVFTFVAYLLHERHLNSTAAAASDTAVNGNSLPTAALSLASGVGTDPNIVPTTTSPLPASTATNIDVAPTTTAAVSASSLYKDGTFTGPQVDVFYGQVQVQVLIQNGKIADVRFLDYPHDRRTSVEINSQVMPWLTQEAIQAQSANVDLISGATLTSEGFVNSLQAALQSAKNN